MAENNNYCYFCDKLLKTIYMYNDIKLCRECQEEFINVCKKYSKNVIKPSNKELENHRKFLKSELRKNYF